MTPEEWAQINDIFHAARAQPGNLRDDFVRQACRGNEQIRRQALALLEADENGRAILPTPAESFSLQPDFILKGRYRVLAQLGCGGFGCVYVAMHEGLKKKVAIKVLHRRSSSNPTLLRLFRQEAEKASSLDHPGIITIHDVDEDNGLHFIVMEFVEGETLRETITRGFIEQEKAAAIAIEIAQALTVTHRADIVHQDIKPENIMIRKADGKVKLVDFGIAFLGAQSAPTRPLQDPTINERETAPIILKEAGTPAYMSPEKWDAQDPDARSDIFSVGVVLHEMLTRERPFKGYSRDEWRNAICNREPELSLRDRQGISRRWEPIVRKALSKDRTRRYQSTEELQRDLERISSKPGWVKFAAIALAMLLVIVTVIAIKVIQQSRVRPVVPVSVRELVNRNIIEGGRVIRGSFSPDSRYVAYSTVSDKGREIWFINAGGGQSMKLTEGNWMDRNPIWSPDKQHQRVAFLSNRNGKNGIWWITVPGVTPIHFGDLDDSSATLIKWSKRQDVIYYESRHNLYKFDVRSGQSTPLTSNPPNASTHSFSVSDDEEKLCWIGGDAQWRLFAGDINGGKAQIIAGAEGEMRSPQWLPDNESLVWVMRKSGVAQIFKGFLDGRTPQPVPTVQNNYDWINVSPDGRLLMASSAEQMASIFSTDVESRLERRIATGLGLQLYPVRSPLTDQIAFQSSNSNPTSDSSILTKSIESSQPVRLAEGFDAKWSPDGGSLAYLQQSTNSSANSSALFTIEANGGKPYMVIADGVRNGGRTSAPYYHLSTNYNWSHDGKRIAYTSRRSGALNIWVVSKDGSGDVMKTDNDDPDLVVDSPFWSLNDKCLAFTFDPRSTSSSSQRSARVLCDGQLTIVLQSEFPLRILGWTAGDYLYVAQGELKPPSTPQRLTLFRIHNQARRVETILHPSAYIYSICLSSDGQRLAFAARVDGSDNLFVVETKGGSPRKVTNNSDSTVFFSGVSLSADKKTLYFSKQLGWTRIWMIENF